ncbi:protein of unknown function [Xaviernesmea oryzae]|uniref:DUF4387 domain-containing protein n=1 Tax=Xaviernesmea oryzae TaxID=464029 RepID=A0A1X7FPA2_9HYPH|nr:DUF4387 domain-containing protein [Xaviernesmea oryzae]SMF56077.1 protein of unknown function [Xaviernesmea oryzae]
MQTLGDIASLMRSKNAGPFYMTFDFMFENEEKYEQARTSTNLTPERIASLYGVPAESVQIHHYRPAWAIKVTMPRKAPSCDPLDTDTHGGQQFAPMVDLPL